MNPRPGNPAPGLRSHMAARVLEEGGDPLPVVRWHPNCSECRQQFTTEIPHQKTCNPRCKAKRKARLAK